MSNLTELEMLLRQGHISRRQLLERAAFLGLAAGASPLLFPGAAKAATPKKGGTFKVGLADASTTDSTDPAFAPNEFSQVLIYSFCNCLTEVTPEQELVGELAESWEAKPGAKEWIFHLRKGIEFHNGKSFEAADVVASIRHHMGEASKSAIKNLMETIEDIKVLDKHTLAITLEAGNADFPWFFLDRNAAIMPANADGTLDWQSRIGTGPYKLQTFEPGVSATLTRNENYWKEGRGHFDAVELIAINDSSARTSALRTGKVHVINRVELKTIDLLAKVPGISIHETPSTTHYTMPMNVTVAPFDNVDVRLALKYAIDREDLLKRVLQGHGRVGNDHPVAPTNPYFDASIEQRAYDPDKARFHLKKAGYDKLDVAISVSDAAFNGATDSCVLYKEHAEAAGINLTVDRVPADGYWDDVWMKKPWCVSYWSGRPTEDWVFSLTYDGSAPWNETFWKNERFDQLLRDARAEIDTAKRREMYSEMQRLCRDDGGAIIPLFTNLIVASSDKVVNGGRMANNQPFDGGRITERWWFA